MNRGAPKWTVGLSLCAVLVASGCSEPDSEADNGGASAPDDSESSATDIAAETSGEDARAAIALAEGIDTPGGDLGAQFAWIVDTINTDGAPAAADGTAHFAPSFLESVPAAQLSAVFGQIRGGGPMTITSIDAEPASLTAAVKAAQPLVLNMSIDTEGLIDGLLLSPDPLAGRPEPTDFDAISAELSEVSQDHHLLAARVEDGVCVPVFERDADEAAPIGSAFKLYVLGALVDAIDRGDLAWDDDLTVTDALKSLPSGTLQEEPDGTTVTVQEAATAMISISDNTATDMLIDAIGVDQVEAVYADMGLQDLDGLTPLLTTRQLFQLGWGADDDPRARWPSADTDEQRAILAELPEGVEGVDAASVTDPKWQEGIDYFVTANEVCAAHVALQERAETPAGEPVRGILAGNPGLPSASEQFDYLGFKGGSAPGELALTWYGEVGDADVVAVVQVAGDSPIDPNVVLGPASDTLQLLRQESDSQ